MQDTMFLDGKWPRRITRTILFLLLFVLACVRQNNVTNYGCEICSDKAGYYFYLPAAFDWGFKADGYKEGFDHQHGDGIKIDRANNKVITKFTCGLATMQLPFYLLGRAANSILNTNQDPYSRFMRFFINIGAAFWCTIGLVFFFRWLTRFVKAQSALITCILCLVGTPLLYYTLDEPLMSHLYSFALFAIALYCAAFFFETNSPKHFLILAISMSMAILIRPTNLLMLFPVLLQSVNTWETVRSRFKQIIFQRLLLLALLFGFLVWVPQLLYWHFAYGKYIVWSYTGEGFYNWASPDFTRTWFSPRSGLFPYAPVLLLSIFTIFPLKKENRTNVVLAISGFISISWLSAAWHNPEFGECNFGLRTFVEYLPVLLLPLAFFIDKIEMFTKSLRLFLYGLLFVSGLYTILLFIGFDTCFTGKSWEWQKFGEIFLKVIHL
jgi:Dolichyl-phosphate-mannose-protein mannosyltransferase